MNQLPDKTVLIALLATLLLVFLLIFSTRPKYHQLQPQMQWRDMPEATSQTQQI